MQQAIGCGIIWAIFLRNSRVRAADVQLESDSLDFLRTSLAQTLCGYPLPLESPTP